MRAKRGLRAGDWNSQRALHRLHSITFDDVAGAQRLPGKAAAGGFAGLYTYDVRVYNGSSFPRMCAAARMRNLLCAPSVGPGFDALRATYR